MRLYDGAIGQSYQVVDLGLEDNITRRLESLGINEGTRVEIFNKKRNGAVIIKVRGTRWAIGKQVAKGLDVKEIAQ